VRTASLFAFVAVLAACRHLPPDKEARAVGPPRVERRLPAVAELQGAWVSTELRGALRDLGHTAVYVFGPDGKYSGAILGDEESIPIAGTYAYADGRLSFDDDALVFQVARVGGVLEWSSPDAFVRLDVLGPRRLDSTQRRGGAEEMVVEASGPSK
jgi:hypothetical protein